MRNLRQAFYDQSDGCARAEAVTSLLLSEHYHRLQEDQSAAGGAGVAAKSVMKSYLMSRKELRLDADVSATSSAAYCLHQQQYGRPARVSSAPVGWGRSCSSSRGGDRSSRALMSRKEADEGVGVESVLREMEQVNRKRLRRFQRKYRRRHNRQHRSRRHAGTATLSFLDEEDAQRHDEGDQTTEGEGDDEWHSKAEGSANNRRPLGGTAGYFTGRNKGERTGDLTSRLALAASASILDSLLLVRGAKDNGAVDDGARSDFFSSIGGGAAVVDSAAASVEEGACSESTVVSEDEGDRDVEGLLRAVRRLDVPLVMVQSTEDALVGTPLPLVLQKEVR